MSTIELKRRLLIELIQSMSEEELLAFIDLIQIIHDAIDDSQNEEG